MPMRCPLEEADRFIGRNLEWVRTKLGNMPCPVPFRDGALIPLRGKLHRIVFAAPGKRRGTVQIDNRTEPPCLRIGGDIEHCARRLEDWLKAEARRDLDARVAWHARRLNLRPKRLTVRDQASRWGSCSTTGGLSFSWRLILAPPNVLDYVAAHEVAHLAEMNHGPGFWKLVRQTCPRMEEARVWLRGMGADLHRYGAADRRAMATDGRAFAADARAARAGA